MKLIATNSETKTIDFHGIELQAPVKTETVAADADGDVYAYYGKNLRQSLENQFWHGEKYEWVATVDLEGMDWRETLVEV